ncbi:MAG TPA: OBAP family protein [Telluria sp.]|nr:OBAP family protein [Telluria sp.]
MNRSVAALLLVAAAGVAAQQPSAPPSNPPGQAKAGKTAALEAGAHLLQSRAPVRGFDVYLVGFHPLKEQPEVQVEAHHYCHQMNEDFAQCMLFDGNTGDANLTGIEYIVSARLYATLPPEERRYWHPHNGEILSGHLVAPGIPAAAEKALMKQKLNSYGKTWHTWHTGAEGTPLPLGPPQLAWSFNRDGEARPGLVQDRDQRLGVSAAEARQRRADLIPLARPQYGVDDLKDRFARPGTAIPGVVPAR